MSRSGRLRLPLPYNFYGHATGYDRSDFKSSKQLSTRHGVLWIPTALTLKDRRVRPRAEQTSCEVDEVTESRLLWLAVVTLSLI